MIDATFAREFAVDWIDSWNSHDLERILSHYTDDFELESPLILERMNEPSGRLRGKAAIRPHWQKGLAMPPPLRFELESVLVGANSIAIAYRRVNGPRVVEIITFNEARQAIAGCAHYQP
jgi:ketosteroid isomerase-like protein